MAGNMLDQPVVVSVYGDSWSTRSAHGAPTIRLQDFKSSCAGGVGYVSGTKRYLVQAYAYGGVSAHDAVLGNAGFCNAIEVNPSTATTFADWVNNDYAQYQVFRYGINDVLRFLSLSPTATELAAAGLDANFNVINIMLWDGVKTAFFNEFKADIEALCAVSVGSGRTPVLVKMPVIDVNSSGAFHWSARHQELMGVTYSVVDAINAAQGFGIVNQSVVPTTPAMRVDVVHLNSEFAHRFSLDFGGRLRTTLSTL